MSLDLCLKQLHVVPIKVFHRMLLLLLYVCSCSTPSFSSLANSSHPMLIRPATPSRLWPGARLSDRSLPLLTAGPRSQRI